jgi:hypothetical protein
VRSVRPVVDTWVEARGVSVHEVVLLDRAVDELAEVGDGTFNLGHADTGGGVRNLAMEVGCLYRVAVDKAEGAHTSTGDVSCRGAAQAAGADDENGRGPESQLACAWSAICPREEGLRGRYP